MDAGGDQVPIAHERLMARRGRQQLRDAGLPFGRMLRIAGMQVVVAAARVGVDEQEALVLARERRAGRRAAGRACGRRRSCRRDTGGGISWNPGRRASAFIHCRARSMRMRTLDFVLCALVPRWGRVGGCCSRHLAFTARLRADTGIAPPTRIRRRGGRIAAAGGHARGDRGTSRERAPGGGGRCREAFRGRRERGRAGARGAGDLERRLARLSRAAAHVHAEPGRRATSSSRRPARASCTYHTDTRGRRRAARPARPTTDAASFPRITGARRTPTQPPARTADPQGSGRSSRPQPRDALAHEGGVHARSGFAEFRRRSPTRCAARAARPATAIRRITRSRAAPGRAVAACGPFVPGRR